MNIIIIKNLNRYVARRACFASAALFIAAMLFCALPTPAFAQDAFSEGAYLDDVYDPFEGVNRALFDFNIAADKILLRPVASGYRAVTTPFIRRRVTNALDNLEEPLNAVHSLLQGNLRNTGDSLTRFMVNSVFGLFGLFDVAGYEGVTSTPEDFGQTLGVWGFGDGPYLVLPLLGPSNLRDGVGKVGDFFINPVGNTFNNNDIEWQRYSLFVVDVVNTRERGLEIVDNLERNSVDFYAAVRNFYKQRRDGSIRNMTTTGDPLAHSQRSADRAFDAFFDEF